MVENQAPEHTEMHIVDWIPALLHAEHNMWTGAVRGCRLDLQSPGSPTERIHVPLVAVCTVTHARFASAEDVCGTCHHSAYVLFH